NDIQAYGEDIYKRRANLNETQALLSEYKDKASQAEASVNALQAQYVDLVKNAEQLQAKIQVHHQKVLFKENNQASQAENLDSLKALVKDIKATIIQLKAQLGDMEKEIAEKASDRDRLLSALEDLSDDSEAAVQAKRTEYITALQKQSSLQNDLSQLEKDMANEAATLKKDQSDQTEKETTLADLKDQFTQSEADKETLGQEIETLLSQYQAKNQAVKAK
ncbi:chromosome segregation protein SMC, partial [Aerococcus tenax]